MTYQYLTDYLKETTSRSVLLSGFGCIHLFVPYINVSQVYTTLKQRVPAGVQLDVSSLKDNNISMKKGLHDQGGLSDIIDKYFKGKGVLYE